MTEVAGDSSALWFVRGMGGLFSLPALILLSAFVGFSGLAAGSGIPASQTVFMVGIVWALPAKVLLIGSIVAGASLPAAFLTVTLSSIRLMPMVAAFIPEIRGRRTPTWLLLFVSHFVAVTAWVLTMERVETIPRDRRLAFFAGLGMTLTAANMVLVAVVYHFVTVLPAMLAGALFFLTPNYFLASLWASARERAVHLALVAGLALAPVCHAVDPRFDLVYAGLVGGTLAFVADRLWGSRGARRR